MEFHHSSSGNDLHYLSEWADSLDLDEFCDQSEVREEPSAKRQKTDHDNLQVETVGELLNYCMIRRYFEGVCILEQRMFV